MSTQKLYAERALVLGFVVLLRREGRQAWNQDQDATGRISIPALPRLWQPVTSDESSKILTDLPSHKSVGQR